MMHIYSKIPFSKNSHPILSLKEINKLKIKKRGVLISSVVFINFTTLVFVWINRSLILILIKLQGN